MYRCESWTIKKSEHQRIDAFELWCWRRILRVPWTARRSNQSILKEISPEHSLEGLMVKLKLQYFCHLMRRTDSLEKTLMGKIEGRRRRGWQRMRWLDGINGHDVWENSGSWGWTGRPGVLQSMGWQRVGHDWATEPNWFFVHNCFSSLAFFFSHNCDIDIQRKSMSREDDSGFEHNFPGLCSQRAFWRLGCFQRGMWKASTFLCDSPLSFLVFSGASPLDLYL